MTEQGDLFEPPPPELAPILDLNKAIAETNAAIEQVEAAADPEWKATALDVVHRLCLERAEFFSDDFWQMFRDLHGAYAEDGTHDARASGPVMRQAAKNGWCIRTNDYRTVKRNHQHLRPVWRSLIVVSK